MDTNNENPLTEVVETTEEVSPLEAKSKEELLEYIKHQDVILHKVRRYEKENKKAAEVALLESQKYKELYEHKVENEAKLKNKLRDTNTKYQLNEVLKEVEVKSPTTLLKLLDRNKFVFDEEDNLDLSSIKSQIDELKKSDPILFGKETITPPTPARSTDGTPTGGYEQELKAAVKSGSQKKLDEVLRKYKII